MKIFEHVTGKVRISQKPVKEGWGMRVLLLAVTAVCIIVFHNFILGKKLFIYKDVGYDTYNQYWPALQYLVNSIQSGKWSLWSFEAGMGNNLAGLAEIILDPFHFLLIFLPQRLVPYGIGMAHIVKIYVCAIFEYKYLKKIGVMDQLAVVFSVIWAFSGYMMLWGQHYQYGSAVAMFTVVIYGLECFIMDGGGKFFILSYSCMMIYSPYFAYETLLFLAVYYVFRYFIRFDFKFRHFSAYLYALFWRGLICFGISAFAFLPGVDAIASSSRYGNSLVNNVRILYEWKRYLGTILQSFSVNLLGSRYYLNIFGTDYYVTPVLCSSVLCLMFSFEFYNKLKDRKKKIIWMAGAVCFCISITTGIVNYVMNGFTNVVYCRWSYFLIFVMIINAAKSMQTLLSDKKTYRIRMAVHSCLVFLCLCMTLFYVFYFYQSDFRMEKVRYAQTIVLILALFAFLYYVLMHCSDRKENAFFWMLLAVVCMEMSWANYDTVNGGGSLLTEDMDKKEGYLDGTKEVAAYLHEKDPGAYRIEKTYRALNGNDALMQNYQGTFYYGLVRSGFYEWMSQFERIKPNNPNRMYAINHNAQLESAVGVKYMLSKEILKKPSYIYADKIGDIYIYRNDGCYSFGYMTDSYVLKNDFEKMSMTQKQECMLQSVILDEKTNLLKENEIRLRKPGYSWKQEDGKLDLFFNQVENDGVSLFLTLKPTEKKDCSIQVYQEKVDEKNLAASVNVSADEEVCEIQIDQKEIRHLIVVTERGIQEDRTDIFARSNCADAKNNHEQMQISDFTDTNIKGTVSCEEDGLLVLSVPDDPGWKIKVDGKESEKITVNYGFFGTYLSAGFHQMELSYCSPYFLAGSVISVFTIVILMTAFVIRKVFGKEWPKL